MSPDRMKLSMTELFDEFFISAATESGRKDQNRLSSSVIGPRRIAAGWVSFPVGHAAPPSIQRFRALISWLASFFRGGILSLPACRTAW